MKLILICLLSLITFTTGCEKIKEEKMGNIELKTDNKKVMFFFPPQYMAKKSSESLLRINIEFPKISPWKEDIKTLDKKIIIFISISDGIEKTEMLIKEALPNYDANFPGQEYYSGQQGPYKVYLEMDDDEGNLKIGAKILVFQSSDGVSVGVRDNGTHGAIYIVNRRLSKNIHLQYLIPKKMGNNFPEIDTAIVNFVNQYSK